MSEYVIRTEAGVLRVAGTRVSLASIVHGFWRGETPEEIQQSFPTLDLERIYGAIAYYLANREAVDGELAQRDLEVERTSRGVREEARALRERLLKARESFAH